MLRLRADAAAPGEKDQIVTRVATLRERWMARTPEEIDDAFDSEPFPADAEIPPA